MGVPSTSGSRPGPQLPARAAAGPVGMGHGVRRDPAFFPQVGAGQVGMSTHAGRIRAAWGQGQRPAHTMLVCVRPTTAVWGACWVGGDGALPPRARGAPTAYLSTTKEPSGPALLLFLLICSFFPYEFCFLNQNQQEFIFLPAPWAEPGSAD